MIIALGESIVAIGVGPPGPLTSGTASPQWPGSSSTAALWWPYFDVVALISARRSGGRVGRVQNEMARDSYSYMHFLMVAGIVLVALGLKETIAHVDDALRTVTAFALLGGLAITCSAWSPSATATSRTVNRGGSAWRSA